MIWVTTLNKTPPDKDFVPRNDSTDLSYISHTLCMQELRQTDPEKIGSPDRIHFSKILELHLYFKIKKKLLMAGTFVFLCKLFWIVEKNANIHEK